VVKTEDYFFSVTQTTIQQSSIQFNIFPVLNITSHETSAEAIQKKNPRVCQKQVLM
jgi:hypothetical protein